MPGTPEGKDDRAVLGITGELKGEEMPVSEPASRAAIAPASICPSRKRICPKPSPPLASPLCSSPPTAAPSRSTGPKEHVNAILAAWYPGEEGGTAVAETLSGKNNLVGRITITFYTSVDQLPPFESYAMKGRTYRYFEGTPLYDFGYGFSYTTFSYSDFTLPTNPVTAGRPMAAEVTVINTGKVAGDEVAQRYLRFPSVAGAPMRALRTFQRVHLDPGQSQRVRFELKPRDLSMVSEAGKAIIPKGTYSVSVAGDEKRFRPSRGRTLMG